MAAEVARLRSPARGPEVSAAEPAPPPPGEPPTLTEAPSDAEAGSGATALSPTTDIDGLFARLRRVEQESSPPVAATHEAAEGGPQEVTEAGPPPAAPLPTAEAGDPFDLRDRLLLPVTNRALRAVKRELTETQNIALEELRVEPDDWRPSSANLAERLIESVEQLLRDAYAAGWAAAAEESETELAVEGDRHGDPAGWAGRFSDALTAAVSAALADSHRDGQGPRQLAAGLSRVYRSWRTDEAERRVRDIASGAYHRGLIDGLRAAGLAAARWVVGGRRCATCREAAEAGAVSLGSVFEDAVTEPPAHNNCGCTLIPA